MADKLTFELVSPERLILSAQVDMVVVPGTEGDFGVLPGHAPTVATIQPGVIEVHDEGHPVNRLFVRGGFAEVTPAGLTILAEEAMALADMDRASFEARLRAAEADVASAGDDTARLKAEQTAEQLRRVLEIIAQN